MKFRLLVIFPILLLAPSVTRAAWLDFIQIDSDWEYLYNNGYFDYNTYQLYRELAEGIGINDTIGYIIGISGALQPEIMASMRSDDTLANSSPDTNPDSIGASLPRAYLRTGQKVYERGNTGYLFASQSSECFSLQLKGRHEDGVWRPERRSLNFANDYLNMTLGNYSQETGLGLVIGRYDYRPVFYESQMKSEEELLYPDNSYYNGIRIELRRNAGVLYSRKKYNRVSKDVVGGWASKYCGAWSAGIALSSTRVNGGAGYRTMAAGSVFATDATGAMRWEVGYAESGAGACLQLAQSGYDLRLWHYDDSFLNLQSSAPAHPDYVPYHDDRFELSFRQSQVGESGLLVSKILGVGKLDVRGTTEIWKKASDHRIDSDNSVFGQFHFSESLLLNVRYSESPMSSGRKALAECGARLRKRFHAALFVSLWIQGERILHSKSICFISGSFPLPARRSLISGRLRLNLDGEFDYFIETSTSIYRNVSLKGTYRWQHSYRNHLGPLYIVMESSL